MFPALALLLLIASPSLAGAADPPSPARTAPPGCLPTDVAFPTDATGPAPAEVTVRFEVGEDGRAQDVSVGFPVDAVVSDLLVQSATRAVQACRWVLPEDRKDGPDPRRVTLRLPVVRAMTKDDRWTPPRMVEKYCFRDAFDPGPFTVRKEVKVVAKFPVFANGKAGRARLLQWVDDPAVQGRFEQAVTAAATSCEWTPGRDEADRPISMYVVLPITLR